MKSAPDRVAVNTVAPARAERHLAAEGAGHIAALPAAGHDEQQEE